MVRITNKTIRDALRDLVSHFDEELDTSLEDMLWSDYFKIGSVRLFNNIAIPTNLYKVAKGTPSLREYLEDSTDNRIMCRFKMDWLREKVNGDTLLPTILSNLNRNCVIEMENDYGYSTIHIIIMNDILAVADSNMYMISPLLANITMLQGDMRSNHFIVCPNVIRMYTSSIFAEIISKFLYRVVTFTEMDEFTSSTILINEGNIPMLEYSKFTNPVRVTNTPKRKLDSIINRLVV